MYNIGIIQNHIIFRDPSSHVLKNAIVGARLVDHDVIITIAASCCGTEKETQALDSLNEKLRDILEEKEIAILTAIHIGGKTARYEYYGISAEKFSIVLNETFSEYPPLPIKIGAESDPEWNNYIETIQQFAMQP